MPSKMLASKPIPSRWKPWFMVLLALVVAASPALPTQAQEAVTRLLELHGSVELRRKGDDTWLPAVAGSALNPGDTLRTAGRSQATILRPDGTTLELYPLSEATVEDEKAVMLLLGTLWSQFQKAIGRPHEIRTPSSVALIRGTVLSVETEAGGASRVAVVEGLVEVHDRLGERREMVGAGFAVRADRDGRLQRLERAHARTLEEGRGFMERVERDRQRRQRDASPEGRTPEGRGSEARIPARNSEHADRREEHPALERRGADVRQEQKLRLEERLERGVEERLERMIDRTQREERREQAEERRESRREEHAQQNGERPNAEQRRELIERLRDRLKRGR